ncbi:hypothetical protein QNI16_10360 [Cytophagaceae bacterium YF14B1]|uniref:Uncharacterized protein n=1 Tax=Xanthocytophaga flava TaxID=3048013 RepID=A0AAE3U618_9BACT|nr:hypothetical protein [Xanthocytophaga flavus]MDJ1480886.1 hypothetical protein [Xanthocytophaga flavus]
MNSNEETYLSYQQAKTLVQTLKLTSPLEWEELCKTGNKPDTIPSDPEHVYGRTGEWKDWQDWLGIPKTDIKKTKGHRKTFLPFEQARDFVRAIKLANRKEWGLYCKSGERPDNIPTNPNRIYTRTGEWTSWQDWLGSLKKQPFLPLEEAKKIIHPLRLRSTFEWNRYVRLGRKPPSIPASPKVFYKKTGEWKDWNDFLGIPADDTSLGYLPYQQARAFVHKLNLKNQRKWQFYRRTGSIPQNIPIDPEIFYTKTGDWTDWKDWLGL